MDSVYTKTTKPKIIDENVWHVDVITARTLVDQDYGSKGEQLPLLTPEQSEWISMVKRIAELEECQLSCIRKHSTQPSVWTITDFQKSSKETVGIEIAVAWFIYIARDTELSQFRIGWDAAEYVCHGNEMSTTSSSTETFTNAFPFGVIIDVNDAFSRVLEGVEEQLRQWTNRLLCLPDTLIQHYVLDDKISCALGISLIDSQIEEDKYSGELALRYAHGHSITLQINKQNGSFRWIYDKNQISEEEVNRMSMHLITLLASAKSTDNAKIAVAKLNLLPKAERDLLLYTWNQTTVNYTPCCLHEFFEAQVELHGQAIAVECNGETLSYAEVNAQANQIAHYLIAQGTQPDDCVALCAERNLKLIISMLGILKSGGVYVPLDPVHPSHRLINILNDSNPKFLLADDAGRAILGDHQAPVINLENSLPSELSINNPEQTKIKLTPANLAYIIYTSGSTGEPKGVMVEHRNAASCIYWMNDVFTAEDFKVTSFSTSVNFDMSLYECFAPLSMGTTLHVIPNAFALTKSSNITMVNTVPSALTAVMNANSLPMSVRTIHLAGEPVTPNLIERIFKQSQATEVCNLYGMTETPFISTMHRYKPGQNDWVETIGRPTTNSRIYLLDAYGQPVPLGSEGEIFISGTRVARGYLNRPELSAERFLRDPFNSNPAVRMYRTGDRARYLSDGNLVYLGRKDQQIKIRGFRVELSEIIAHLIEHPQIIDAVVQTNGYRSDLRLVAYLVTDNEDKLFCRNLRSYLSNLLPDYMVPAAYVRLKSLPLTPNGKLDRRALPAPDDDAYARQKYEAPQGVLEEKLAHIWSELLNIQKISRNDNFFGLGGHSLLVTKLLAHLRHLGLDTNVREVFNAPTLAALASMLTRYKAVTIPPNLITRDSIKITSEMLPLITLSQTDIDMIIAQIPGGLANIQDIYGLTPLQNGMLYHHLMAKRGDPYLLVRRLRFINRKSLEQYRNAMQQLIKRHDIFRTAIFWDNLSEPAQIVLRQVPSIFTDVTLDESREPVKDRLSQKFDLRHYRLNLTQAPLLRLQAASESDGNWVALQLMHHSIVDQSTLERLQKEIHAIVNGKIETLTFPTPFRNFVAQTRLGTNHAVHTRFFSEMLGDIDEPTLPFGLSDLGLDDADVNKSQIMLSQKLTYQLRTHARNLQVSLAGICHLAWAQVVAKACERESVVYGTVLIGRLQAENGNNSAMGPMINTLPLRLNIDERSIDTVVHHTH